MNYARLQTERQNPRTRNIDLQSTSRILQTIHREDRAILPAIQKTHKRLAEAVDLVVQCLKNGGRLFLIGAGTSGRLGVLEAAECPPTFDTPPPLVQAIMAGGRRAVFRSQEGTEDDEREARRQIRIKVRRNDVVVGIAASGVTPFVRAALREAKRSGAKTILVTANPRLRVPLRADILIAPKTGPEVITGSTRLKAGTAAKLILNRLTTASMIRLGKVYHNWMVELQPKSKKLKARALRLVQGLGQVGPRKAERLLHRAKGKTKVAILMSRKSLTGPQAVRNLQEAQGFLRVALR